MKTQKVKISEIKQNPKNPRIIKDEKFKKLVKSIQDFPKMLEIRPIVVDSDMIVLGGNMRLKACIEAGLKEVPVICADDLTEDEKKEFIIKDNVGFGEWNWDDLVNDWDLAKLEEWGMDLPEFEVEKVEGLTDEDAVPEVPEEPVTKLGDVWILGNHRLMCGDSTSIDAVEKLMDGGKADVLFTDPPYGINFKPQRGTHDIILNDNLDGAEFDDFLDGVFGTALAAMKPDTYAFVWTGWAKIGAFERSLQKFFKIQAMHIWVKNNFGIGYYSRPKHEPFYLCLNGKPVYPSTAPADVWDHARVHKTVHSCEKPVGLIEDILNIYHKNSVVLDLFGGSGSTLIACEKTNRHARLMELSPAYCDVIIKRWEDFTGKKAILEK